ncbi:fanconi-associated nuclease 1 homolog [Coffea eugenioides]|uniref:fanconi-associated nuclease 1 homolog n=1 Tax=Coffea eugenioides TaxID=49369 RepID=UPI000F609409|nr:fanconi-associated nuclease 1 homolog [Coffea eugenioides]
MLTGRESLKRLIGKRRRFLPNRHSIISSALPSPESTLNLWKKEEVDDETSSGDDKNGAPELVSCPICGVEVPGDNDVINFHLDACLARGTEPCDAIVSNSRLDACIVRGTKRKLSQRTLFQLNFCSRSKVKVHSVVLDSAEVADVAESDSINGIRWYRHHGYDDTECFEKCSSNQVEWPLESVATGNNDVAGYADKPVNDEVIENDVDSPSLPSEGKVSEKDRQEPMEDDELSELSLQTFIVGRKFADQTELTLQTKMILSRDPENPKDPNAIKVVSADRGCNNVIGFLPRKLAEHLSPLIDKFHLYFEGHVTSVPQHALAVVPIQIFCQNKSVLDGKDCDSWKLFKSLWRHAVYAVDSAKTRPPGMTGYQQNLVLMIQEVLKSHSHLLTDGEKTFLERLTLLSDDSQRLFARLYTRKGPWFRMSNISYTEILDCEGAIKELSEAGFLCSIESDNNVQEDDLKEILNVLNVGELRELVNSVIDENFTRTYWKRHKKCTPVMKKQDLISSLLSSYKDNICSNLLSLILLKTAVCVRVTASAESLIWRAERLFFLNGEQDLSSFLLVDLGIIKYPTYNCILSDHIFRYRNELLSYEEAIEVAQIMDESLDLNNSELVSRCIEVSDHRIFNPVQAVQSSTAGSIDTFLSCFSASWVYSKVVLLGVSFLERELRYIEAIKLLKRLLVNFISDRRRGYWTLRLSVDLEHVGRINESLQVAEDGLLDPWVRAGSRLALQRRVLRLGRPPRRWRTPSYSQSVKRKITEVHIQGRPLNSKTGMRSIFYGEDGEQCGVEELALQYYTGEGGAWMGVHTESGIWLTIFGLLMWDIMFADVPNAFCTKFQTAPLDLETDSFYAARKSLIEGVLGKINDGMAEEILITSWELHAGTACRGVNWEKHSLAELRAAVTCIGGPCLASICRHLAQDYRSWSSGMPDLLLWRFHDNYKGEAKLVEVKGPRDRLSEQQRAWLLFLMDCGFNVEVCKVTAPVVK